MAVSATINNYTSLTKLSGEVAKRYQNEKKENGPMALGPAALSVDRGVKVNEQKRFGGPGSSPPSCRSKCGWCTLARVLR